MPNELIAKCKQFDLGLLSSEELALAEAAALSDTITEFEATASPVITDGQQRKADFLAYPLRGVQNLTGGAFGVSIRDSSFCSLPKLTSGPFRYGEHAVEYLRTAQARTSLPLKQAVVSASAISLAYPSQRLPGYSREQFLCHVVDEVERDIRQCLNEGADSVQMDFTEANLAIKMDPSLKLLDEFIEINNWVFERFFEQERCRIGVHCRHNSGPVANLLLPALFRLKAGRFYLQLSREKDRTSLLAAIRANLGSGQLIFVGVTDPANQNVETPEDVRDRVLEAARFLPLDQLGTTDDCGFSPATGGHIISRETAFAKIRARLNGTGMARQLLAS